MRERGKQSCVAVEKPEMVHAATGEGRADSPESQGK